MDMERQISFVPILNNFLPLQHKEINIIEISFPLNDWFHYMLESFSCM